MVRETAGEPAVEPAGEDVGVGVVVGGRASRLQPRKARAKGKQPATHAARERRVVGAVRRADLLLPRRPRVRGIRQMRRFSDETVFKVMKLTENPRWSWSQGTTAGVGAGRGGVWGGWGRAPRRDVSS